MSRSLEIVRACVAALLLVGMAAMANPLAARAKFGDIDARLRNADREPQNWPMYSGNDSAWRYSALDQINVDTVKDLKLALPERRRRVETRGRGLCPEEQKHDQLGS